MHEQQEQCRIQMRDEGGSTAWRDDGDKDRAAVFARARARSLSHARRPNDKKIRETWDTINLYFI